MSRTKRDATGQKFSRWTILSFHSGKGNAIKWNCRCECGTERPVMIRSLRTGVSKSCGCLWKEYVDSITTHGMTNSMEFKIWQGMNQRCHNEKSSGWKDYGGRGIFVCERWRESFENFYEDMGACPSKSHSIDREDNSEGYFPGNCKWSTKTQQARNMRSNHNITHNGLTLTVTEWAEKTGVNKQTIYSRIRNGLSIPEVLSPIVDEKTSRIASFRKKKT